MRALELRIPPVALWVALAALVVALARLVPSANMPFPGHRMLASACIVMGVLVALAGVLEFRRARTTVNPMTPQGSSSIVTSGVYRYTRNPMYLGMAAALAGVALWSASLAGLLLVPVFCAFISRFQIQPEERVLLAGFGDGFAAYMARVRRWI